MQHFMPNDPAMQPIYDLCVKYNKPILFEAGMTWVKNSPSKYSNPLLFEDVAIANPELRFCLGHFGWPWTRETVMLILKYPNVFADTALLYFDSPSQFFDTTFNHQLGEYWIDRMLYDAHRAEAYGQGHAGFESAAAAAPHGHGRQRAPVYGNGGSDQWLSILRPSS